MIELSAFEKTAGGPLSKRISVGPDGKIASDGSACTMARGVAARVRISGFEELATLIECLSSKQAIALGALRDGLPETVPIVTKGAIKRGVAANNAVARTVENFFYRPGQPALTLIDYDSKGMPTTVEQKLANAGGFWPALVSVLPVLARVGRLERLSTSAGLSRTDTGETFPGSGGLHTYIEAVDGADVARFLKALHERCWLAGFGWLMVGTAGQLLDRSIVDRMVGQGERLIFEGAPELKPPLRQDAIARRPSVVAGEVLDTLAACPPLTIVERSRVDELKAKERERLAPEAAKARAAFVARQAAKLVASKGLSEAAARAIVERQCDGVLRPDVELLFDDEELAGCTVGDVLADPERFEGATLADPLEGVVYGVGVAKIMLRSDGTPWIHSFAHGRTVYELRHDAVSVRKVMEAAAKADVVAAFIRLAVGADLDAIELETLRHLAKELSDSGLSAINAALKAAKKQHGAQQARAAQTQHAAQRQDPRPLLRAPFLTDPWLPQMAVLNEVIGAVAADMPPVRNIDADATRVRKLPVPNMHAFTDANEPEGDAE